jgi:hypothetical protein
VTRRGRFLYRGSTRAAPPNRAPRNRPVARDRKQRARCARPDNIAAAASAVAAPVIIKTIVMPQPNLLLAGFVKCGTTSLAKYLGHHPAVLVPVANELYYLIDRDSPLASTRAAIGRMRSAAHSINGHPCGYPDYFPVRNGERYALDATPHYYPQTAALDYARADPDVKVVFMIRDPVARLVSSYRSIHGMLQEYPPASFERFVDTLLDANAKCNAYRRRIRRAYFRYLFDVELDMGCYERHFARWRSAIGRERMFIGTMEEFREVPGVLMRRLCRFLGLDPATYDAFDFAPEARFNRVMDQAAWVALDGSCRNIQIGRAPDLDHRTLARLYDFYLPHNRRLRDAYGIDYVMPGLSPKELRAAAAGSG